MYGSWKPAEDDLLRMAYDKHGPAWTVVSFSLPKRTPSDCRKRHLKITDVLKDERLKDPRAFHLVVHDGYDLAKDDHFIRSPIEKVEENPITKLAGLVPQRPRHGPLKSEWSEAERMLVMEGYTMWGPNWRFIAQKLVRRSPEEVQSMWERWALELNQIQ